MRAELNEMQQYIIIEIRNDKVLGPSPLKMDDDSEEYVHLLQLMLAEQGGEKLKMNS